MAHVVQEMDSVPFRMNPSDVLNQYKTAFAFFLNNNHAIDIDSRRRFFFKRLQYYTTGVEFYRR